MQRPIIGTECATPSTRCQYSGIPSLRPLRLLARPAGTGAPSPERLRDASSPCGWTLMSSTPYLTTSNDSSEDIYALHMISLIFNMHGGKGWGMLRFGALASKQEAHAWWYQCTREVVSGLLRLPRLMASGLKRFPQYMHSKFLLLEAGGWSTSSRCFAMRQADGWCPSCSCPLTGRAKEPSWNAASFADEVYRVEQTINSARNNCI